MEEYRPEFNMRQSTSGRHACGLLPLTALVALIFAGPHQLTGRERARIDDDKPELTLRSTPKIGFAPAEILFIAELRGGADDYEDLYCATIEWDWDDDTRSESTPDCDPYEQGTSKIRRRFSTRHKFEYGRRYEVRLRLKQGDNTVASARTTVELRGGDRFR